MRTRFTALLCTLVASTGAALATTAVPGGGSTAARAATSDIRSHFLGDAELEAVRRNVETNAWAAGSWQRIHRQAENDLGHVPSPANPDLDYSEDGRGAGDCATSGKVGWFCTLYLPGHRDGRAALNLALAARITGDSRYAAAARRILFAWVGTYSHPAARVGHMVAEPVGPMIKLMMAFDLLQPVLTADERARVRSWAAQWIAVGKRLADDAVDNPWVEAVTVGGRTINPSGYGNSPFGQRAMAVWAAATAGEPHLSETLRWNWQHSTPGGTENGWLRIVDGMLIPGAGGETLEGRLRQSVGYGLYGWSELMLIADVARRAGFGVNLFTAATASGASLLSPVAFYGPILSGARPNPYAAAETFGGGSYESALSEYRAVFETAWLNCPAGSPLCAPVAAALATGGDAVRAANDDAHFWRWRAVVGASLGSVPPPAPAPTAPAEEPAAEEPGAPEPAPGEPAPAPAPVSGNLVPNPSFEADPAGSYTTHGRGAFAWVSGVAHSGTRSVAITTGEPDGEMDRWLTRREAITVTPGRTVSVSGWVRTDTELAHGNLAGTYWRADGTFAGAAESGRITAECAPLTWCKVGFTSVVPADAANLRVEVRLDGLGTLWADDLDVR